MPPWLVALLKGGLAFAEAYAQHMAEIEAKRAQVNAEAKENLAAVDPPAAAPT